MDSPKGKNNVQRAIAFLCAFIVVLTFVLTGCGTSKIEAETTTSTTESTQVYTYPTSEYTEPTAQSTSAFVTAQQKVDYVVGNKGTTKKNTATTKKQQGNLGSTGGTTNKRPQTTEELVYNDMAVQRKFGFNIAYDAAVNLVLMNIEEVRTYFTYAGKDWLLEFWKGEYEFVTVGGEVGIYCHENTSGKAPSRPEMFHYDAVENKDALYMTMEVWQCDSMGERKVISMPRMKYWWCAAFKQGTLEKHSRRSDLVLVTTIEFKDAGMLNAFVESFKKKPFTQKTGNITYKDADAFVVNKSNNSVKIAWKYLEE